MQTYIKKPDSFIVIWRQFRLSEAMLSELEPVPDAAGGGEQLLGLRGAPRQLEAGAGQERRRPSSPRSTSPPNKELKDVSVVTARVAPPPLPPPMTQLNPLNCCVGRRHHSWEAERRDDDGGGRESRRRTRTWERVLPISDGRPHLNVRQYSAKRNSLYSYI